MSSEANPSRISKGEIFPSLSKSIFMNKSIVVVPLLFNQVAKSISSGWKAANASTGAAFIGSAFGMTTPSSV